MKKLLLLLIPFIFFASCQQFIDYKLLNETDYNVSLVDQASQRYELLAHEEKIISHPNSARFEIINNQYPIYIQNNFTFSVVKNMPTYEIHVYNDTSTQYVLQVSNDPFQTSYTIDPGIYVLKIYTNNPTVQLYLSDTECHNYNFSNNTLHIF